jgi:hypothetical protein
VYAVGLGEWRITEENLHFAVPGHPFFLGHEGKPCPHAPILGYDMATVDVVQVIQKVKILL